MIYQIGYIEKHDSEIAVIPLREILEVDYSIISSKLKDVDDVFENIKLIDSVNSSLEEIYAMYKRYQESNSINEFIHKIDEKLNFYLSSISTYFWRWETYIKQNFSQNSKHLYSSEF